MGIPQVPRCGGNSRCQGKVVPRALQHSRKRASGQARKDRSTAGDVDKDCTPTAYGVKSLARKITRELRKTWWSRASLDLSERYRSWDLTYHIRCPKELEVLTRPALHRYLAIRTGHGDFAWYHRRFGHPDANLKCSCGRDKDPEHLVCCGKTLATFDRWPCKPIRRPRSEKEARSYLKTLISNPLAFQEFLGTTGFYNSICPR